MNDYDDDPGEVFRIPDLWRPSTCQTFDLDDSGLLFARLRLDDLDIKLPDVVQPSEYHDTFFSIPDFPLGPLDNISAPSLSTSVREDTPELLYSKHEDFEDIWLLPEETPLKVANFQSWDEFEVPSFNEPRTAYITEAGASVFDAAVAGDEDYFRIANSENLGVCPKLYISSILALGLGRNSIFYNWNEKKRIFEPTLAKMRISGYSSEALASLVRLFMDCGNITRYLQAFVSRSYEQSQAPGEIALADTVSTLLVTIQSHLSVSASTQNGILQLQNLFQPAHSILTCFRRMVQNVSSTRNNEAMLSTIFQEIQLLEHRTDSLRSILLEVLSRVSKPWLEFSSEWLGLQRESGLPMTKEGKSKSFVRVENREWVDEQGFEMFEPDFILDYDKVPSFMSPEDARSMFEVGRSLRFLRAHHPTHPLSRADIIVAAEPPSLEWQFSWENIVQVEGKALKYERDITIALREFAQGVDLSTHHTYTPPAHEPYQLNIFGQREEDMQAHLVASIDSFSRVPPQDLIPDPLAIGLIQFLASDERSPQDESVFAPPISLSPLLSFNPIIAAQARIVNRTCMHMFFKSHKLREHLTLQRRFHLLGDGVFSSRLTHALFDPELESAERHRGVARSGGIMGLRLGGRDTWPPASSELRLALMGVLTESYAPANSLDKPAVGTFLDQTSLPGDMSFAVRDMSEEEIEKCMNADSIEALDFLRLSYKPPAPLDAVITPIILFKYDQLFKLLLRVLRMLYVVSTLHRDTNDRRSGTHQIDQVAQKFRIEAHHFISCVSGYFFDTGVESTWRIFGRKLDQVEAMINSDNDDIALGQNEGIDKLRDYHEQVLDKIMSALLLRKRQQPVMALLEQIFSVILEFAKYSRERVIDPTGGDSGDDDVKALYVKFRKKVGVFITVCRGLSEKKGQGEKRSMDVRGTGEVGLFDGQDLAEQNTISQLLVRLELSSYYSTPVRI